MKQHFQKGTLKFIEETIELQKKQNWNKPNKLILNSSLAINPQLREITRKSWNGFLKNLSQVKLKVVYNHQK